MGMTVLHTLALVSGALAVAGLAQAFAGAVALHGFRRRTVPVACTLPPITVLKPLHGDEPMLEAALASFCEQDYPEYQLVFGLQDPLDPALAVLERLRARFPALDMTVVVDAASHGLNRKIANLINMHRASRHDVLVVADSDIHVAPDYLRHLAATLELPGTGMATTLYAGLPPRLPGLAGQMGAAHINHSFLPGALMARALGRQDCLGATMALRRDMLDAVGGFAALADHLADDAMLGQLVRARGLAVRLASTVPATTVPETRLLRLFQHELRWARTIHAVAPVGFVLSAVQYPLVWAALALALSGAAPWAMALLTLTWAGRVACGRAVDRLLRVRVTSPWLLPLRDAMSVAVMLASYAGTRVAWRGQVLRARPLRIPQRHPATTPARLRADRGIA